MESKKFLNADEVTTEFGLDAAALKQFVDSGEVRALADRGTWKYRRDELQALVAAGKIQPPSSDFAVEPDGDQVLRFQTPDEDVSYIELDEDALAEQATIITKSGPVLPESTSEPEQDWFAPSDAPEMSASKEQSSSDVAIYSGTSADVLAEEAVPRDQSSSDVAIYSGPNTATGSSDDAPSIAADSDSDVRIASDFSPSKPEDSGILLDFNLDAGATVSSSGSSLRLPQTLAETPNAASGDQESSEWDDDATAFAAGDSKVGVTSDESGISLGGDSGIQLIDASGSRVRLGDESGILLGEGSHIGSSILGESIGEVKDESGISIDSLGRDSGITLDSLKDDSGITLEGSHISKADSGITLSTGDSGISLSTGDSGITLGTMDSGLSLQSAGDSGISIEGNDKTLADGLLVRSGDDQTQTLDLTNELDDDSAFDLNLDDGDATAELLLDDEDDADETSATVVRKGRRPEPGSLSAAFELDDAAEVEDLEISQDLDAGVEEEIEELSDDEEVFDASDETFSGDEVEATEDEDYLEPAAKSKVPSGPREPSWGVDMAIGLVACSLFLAANSLILWGGVSTMWNGADAEGPAAPLIQTFGDLIK